MSAATTQAWKRSHAEYVRKVNRAYMRQQRREAGMAERDLDWGIQQAFAERFGVARKIIRKVGTRQLCLCRLDEARRILLHAVKAESVAGKKANAAVNQKRKAA